MSDNPRYKTARWQAIRGIQLEREPWCAFCKRKGRRTRATVCDHVTPHRNDWTAFWSGPFASLCASCHSVAKQAEERHGYSLEVGDDGMPLDPAHPFNRVR